MSSQKWSGHYVFHVYGNICGIGGVFNNLSVTKIEHKVKINIKQ